ncbi:hypothetical protein RH831_01590 [Halodesulfurarchaeum sp. HSR-GB]|uniref:DUF7124 domain-containing protein n=1 Tax=Halodesulfurarchaeum sp. HSR-GB TaxID=3074077 RepID=UPI002862FA09|nr:hypothetical protein [Halodesulfurarchaeum sp. HSR-GB]MDR5655876.1 hypothetical protein [Halodesulfurarchaeum sp. HSR-GB]
MSTPDGGGMTLAFELSALQSLAEPGTAFADARQWTEFTGVVTNGDPDRFARYTRKRRIRPDFATRDRNIIETLEGVMAEYEADRYVLVTDGEADREPVEAAGWEYLPIEEAAAAADWAVGTQRKPDGDVERTDWP